MDSLALLIYLQMTLYATIAFTALLYACVILYNRRFRDTSNILIANICLSITISAIYFTSYFPTITNIPDTPYLCVFFIYAFNVASIAIPFSFVAFTAHRFCIIVYHRNGLFKKKRLAVMCMIGFWILELIISLPFIGEYDQYCNLKVWMGYYTFFLAVVVPLVVNIVLDIRIFQFVRNSARRVQPQRAAVMASGNNNPRIKISRRGISLLKHIIFTFLVFIVGWTPAFLLNLIDTITPGHIFQIIYCMYLCAACTLGIIIYLFVFNYELRKYLCNSIRRCFQGR